MNEIKSRQSEGYDYYDYREHQFNAAGGVETPYVAGNAANVAVPGSWPSDSGIYTTTLLTAGVAPGAVNVPVGNVAGFAAGQTVYIVDAANIMANVVGAILPAPVNTLVMALPLTVAFALGNGAFVINALPYDAHSTMLYSDQNCLVRLLNRNAVSQKMLPATSPGNIPAGAFVQMLVPAGQYIIVPAKWIALFAVGQANAGTLRIWSSG